jgi:hypothetical protein
LNEIAGQEGIEPPTEVLETSVIPFNYWPTDYLSFSLSLCSVTFLQCLQNFFSNNFSSVFILFLVVT